MTTQVLAEKTHAPVRPRSSALPGQASRLPDLLRLPGIVQLSVSNGLVQSFGQRMQGIAVAWLVLEMTGSKLWLGVVNGLPVLSVVVFSLLGGVIADRQSAKRVMLVSRSTLAVMAFATAGLVTTGQVATVHLAVYVLFAVGIGAVDMPVARNYLFGVVGGPRLLSANAVQSVFMNVINIVMPVSAGLLIGLGGPEGAFLLLGAGYALAAVLILSTRSTQVPQAQKGTKPLADVVAGLAYIRSTPAVAALLAVTFLVPVAGIYFAMVPVMAREVLGVGAGGLGVLVASFSAGGLAGSVYLTAGGGIRRRGWKLSLIGVAFGVGMMAFAMSHSFVLSCAVSLVMGVLAAFWQNMLGVMVQVVAAPEMRGRVTSVFTMGFQLIGLGWLAGGFLAAAIGVEAAVLLGGVAFSGLSLAVFTLSPDLRRID